MVRRRARRAVAPDTRRLALADNVPGLGGMLPSAELVTARWLGRDLPVQVDNDINLAALGEQWRGVARGVHDFAFLTIGTGLGAGWCWR